MQSLVNKGTAFKVKHISLRPLKGAVIIKFSERDRVRGVATLMRHSELFRPLDKYRFMIRRKELSLFKDKNIAYIIQR